MNYDYEYQQTPFSKAVMTGLFAGISATLACLVYGFFYRMRTGFTLSEIINVPSIIISCHLILTICGMLYNVFTTNIKKGAFLFSLLFILVTAFCIWKTESVERSPVHQLTVQFRGLSIGMEAIIGLSAAILIPVLYNSKKFEKGVL